MCIWKHQIEGRDTTLKKAILHLKRANGLYLVALKTSNNKFNFDFRKYPPTLLEKNFDKSSCSNHQGNRIDLL